MNLQEILNKSYLINLSEFNSLDQLRRNYSISNEQGIYGNIIDINVRFNFNDLIKKNTLVAIDFPYHGFDCNLVLQESLITSINRLIFEEEDWGKLKAKFKKIKLENEIWYVIDTSWIKNEDQINRLLSITNSYKNINIAIYSTNNNTSANFAKILGDGCLGKTMFIPPLTANINSSFLLDILSYKIDFLGLWPRNIVQLIQS